MGDFNTLNVVNWNSRSILPKRIEFFDFLIRHQVDIATVTETWLAPQNSFHHPQFNCIRADRRSRNNERGGGVLIVVKKGIQFSQLDLNTRVIETVGIEIKNATLTIHIIAAYFPGEHRGVVWNNFRSDIDNLVRRPEPFFVAGDFNARHRLWNCLRANKAGNILATRSSSSDFFIHAPNSFTYNPHNGRKPSTLDLVLSNNLVNMSALSVVNDLSSDHLPVRFDIDLVAPPNSVNLTSRCYARANWNLFKRLVNEKIDLTSAVVNNLNSPAAIDSSVQFLTTTLQEAEAVSVPNAPVKPYKDAKVSTSTRQLIQLRNTRRRQWMRTRDPLLLMIVESLNRRIREDCSLARNHHFSRTILNLDNGAKDVWKISKALRKNVKYSPPLQKVDTNSLISSPLEKANLLAECFASTHRNPLPGDVQTTYAVDASISFIENSATTENDVPLIRPREIERIIRSMKPRKAPGQDKIRNLLLKHLPRKGLVMITKIVNACLKNCYFPSSWKHAIVTAIPKPGKDVTLPTNYRPISLLPSMSKILERVILSRIERHLENHNIVPPQQFGFKRGHSTNHQLVRLTQHIKQSFSRGQSAGMVLLDVEKAYDSVWQEAILHKMRVADFPLYILKLLQSFLMQRSFQVIVNGELSRAHQIPYGVPQGAVLSPVLYNIFTADIVTVNDVEYFLFADDTGFVAADKTPEVIIEKLQSAQDAIENYQRRWRIRINPMKTQAIFFTRRRNQRFLPQTQITAMNHAVPWSEEAKYLGLTMDPKLKFDKHIAASLSRCDKLIKMLYPLISRRSRLSNQNKILIYKMIFRPIITYGFPAWHSCAQSRRLKLQVKQNKILKMMLDLPFNFPSDELQEVSHTESLSLWTTRLLQKFWTGCTMSENELIVGLVP